MVKRLQTGDLEAFDLIYEKYAGKLYLFGLKYLRSNAEAEELTQSVFLKLWETHKHIDYNLSFKSYLFTIAYNDICKIFRKRKYMQKFIMETFYENSQSSSKTEEDIDFKSDMDRLEQIVDMLPKRQKIIFRKSRQEGKTTKEIASELGISPGTIDNYISKALSFIRSRLKYNRISSLLFVLLFFF